LKSLSREQIHAQLVHILSAENLEFEAPALSQIARAAAGSMRDALSLTDQAIAQGNNRVTLDTVISMLGLLDKNQVLRLAKCICERDAENAMQQLDEICADSPDYSQVLSQLLALFHQVALTQIVPDICKLDTNAAKPVYTLSKAVSAEHIQLLYQIGLNGKRDLPFAPDALTGLQMTVMRMIAFTPAQSIPLEISAPVAANNSDLVSQGAAGSHTSTTGESANEQLSSSSLDSPKIHNMSVNSPEVSSSSTPNDADGKSIDLDEVSIESNAHIDTEVSSRSFAVDERYETHEYLLDSSQNEGYHVDDHPRNLNVEQQSPVEHNAGTFDQEPAKSSNTDAQPETEEDSVAHLQGLFDMEQDLASYEQQALGDTDAKKPEAHYREAAPAALQEAPAPAPILANQAPVHTPRSANTEAHNDLSNRESAAPAPQKTSEPVPALPAQGRPEIAAYLENGDKLVLAAQIDRWSQFVDSLGVRGLARQLLVHSRSTGIKDNCLLLEIDKSHHHLNENSSIQTIKEALSLKCERSIEVNVDYALVGNTPYELQQQIDAMRLDHAKETVGNDNAFQELIKAFDAQVIEDSIEAR
jgi:DNA polymerase-3 subunit gamma/tau